MKLGSHWFPALALAVADQAQKLWMSASFPLLRRYEAFGNPFLVLARVHNRGLMGDRLSTIPRGHIEPYTQYLPALCLIAFLWMAHRLWPKPDRAQRTFKALLAVGGLSNLVDHVRQGYVVDTLQLLMPHGIYLPFNLADCSILVGGVGLAWCLVRELRASQDAVPRGAPYS